MEMIDLGNMEKHPRVKTMCQTNSRSKLTLLQQKPKPLFSKDLHLALFWSAKSGCTFATKWFFYQSGLLEAAYLYHHWIHRYRLEVFYESQDYELHLDKILDPETQVIKVVRNPYSRAVSSYIHAVKHSYEDKKIGKFLNREVNQNEGFSFVEFLDYLESIDLSNCNGHHQQQLHISEKEGIIKPRYIVYLENSKEAIQELEIKLELRRSEFHELLHSRHHSLREDDTFFCGDSQFCKSLGRQNKSFPKTRAFYNKNLQDKVFQLYRLDFEAYQYEPDAIPE
jgi:Sulfotransferase family